MHNFFITAPDEQGPPTATLRGSTYIILTWNAPEVPNGIIIGYLLYRNGSDIANITNQMYNDTGLIPNTYYGYRLESYNLIDSTVSSEVVFKTLEGIPTGINAPILMAINSTAVSATWTEPTVAHGIISQYVLLLANSSASSIFEEVFQGNTFSHTVTDLKPFTLYSFMVQACTTGGCGSSTSSEVVTEQASPTSQPAPSVTTLGDTQLLVEWEAPSEPNGIITEYRVFQRGDPFEGEGENISAVNGTTRSVVASNLEPFTSYQFSVESYTEAGGTFSEWSDGKTGEAGMCTPPFPSPYSRTSLILSLNSSKWSEST